MYQSDYILRLITQVGQMLRAMVHALHEHRPDDALETARDAVAALTETDPALVDAMTGEGLVTFLSAGGSIDVLRCRMLAEVLIARSEAYRALGDEARAAIERTRARALLEAASREAEGDQGELITRLLEELGDSTAGA